ncbi:MAG: LytTR family DNA-binding domain-containing protein [Balneolaceae bacterium]|nr:LytTR family DNA-binding domain-containing protein [Balneolaceae bacterium]
MNRILTCMVVDDEPSAQKVLLQYIADAPQLQAGPVCSDALEALEKLRQEKVDLLLLDVNMPRLSGISLLRSLDDPPPVILTTAYDDYALEGYELDLVDYLLKPFSFERFLKAVRKAEERTGREGSAEKFLMVKADKKSWKVDLEEILYIESLGDYVTVHTPHRKLTTYDSLKNLQETLPGELFMRAHKSYLVALAHIDYMEGNRLFVEETEIPIGATYRDEVKRRLQA